MKSLPPQYHYRNTIPKFFANLRKKQYELMAGMHWIKNIKKVRNLDIKE